MERRHRDPTGAPHEVSLFMERRSLWSAALQSGRAITPAPLWSAALQSGTMEHRPARAAVPTLVLSPVPVWRPALHTVPIWRPALHTVPLWRAALHRRGAVEAAGIEPASESLPQRPLHAYPGCVGRHARKRPPRSPPSRINPANRGTAAIPGVSLTARERRLSSPPGRRPFPSRQAGSGRTWLKQPEPAECRWRLCVFHRLRKVDPRHAVAASCTFVEPSTPPLPHRAGGRFTGLGGGHGVAPRTRT